jgi:integrase/recombinase XerD
MAKNALHVGTLPDLVEDYLDDCKNGKRRLSALTVDQSYKFPLKDIFLPYCETAGIKTLADLGEAEDLFDRLTVAVQRRTRRDGKPLSPFSVKAYMGAIRSFLRWTEKKRGGPRVEVEMPETPDVEFEVLTIQEIDAMEQAARTARDKVLVRALADTGLRVSELLGLTLDDVLEVDHGRQKAYFLHVRGKGSRGKGPKHRDVPIERQLYRRLRDLARENASLDSRSDKLFLGLRRRPGGEIVALTRSGVDQVIRSLGERARIKKRVYPHLLRHTYITMAANSSMPLKSLMDIVGHSSLGMITRVYAHKQPAAAYAAQIEFLRGLRETGS